MGRIAILLLFGSWAFAQDTEHTFRLKNAAAGAGVQEIATAIRVVAQFSQISVDVRAATIVVKGNAEQLALADWLIPKLDVTERSNLPPQEYRVRRTGDDIVMVYELEHTLSNTGLQEIITTIRTVGDVQKIYNISSPKIIVLRGDSNEVSFARFLLQELDQASEPRENARVRSFHLSGTKFDSAMVYGLVNTESGAPMQLLLTGLRTVIDIQKIYMVSAPKLLAIRGTPADIQMAEWLIPQLDRKASKSEGNEMRMPNGNDDVVHVFYLKNLKDVKAVNEVATNLRATSRIGRIYAYLQPVAIVVRGTADQVAMLGRMITLRDLPSLQ